MTVLRIMLILLTKASRRDFGSLAVGERGLNFPILSSEIYFVLLSSAYITVGQNYVDHTPNIVSFW